MLFVTVETDRLTASPAAWFGTEIPAFLASSVAEVIGRLALANPFDDFHEQREAWETEIAVLHESLRDLEGWVYLEFHVPRLGSRIDVVVMSGSALVPIEFKVGQHEFLRANLEQAWDYGLDLKNFHAASHGADIFPILVATDAREVEPDWAAPHGDGVRRPLCTNAAGLRHALRCARLLAKGPPIDGRARGAAPYRPTPTIVQAARALYAGHSVDAISRSDAGAKNLRLTSHRVEAVIEDAASEFQVQGLELDWVCTTWDADLRRAGDEWAYHSFRGDAWTNVHKRDRQRYLLNAYRVLLTRARQGMVIFVPRGEPGDPTRVPAFYDETHEYLAEVGVPSLE